MIGAKSKPTIALDAIVSGRAAEDPDYSVHLGPDSFYLGFDRATRQKFIRTILNIEAELDVLESEFGQSRSVTARIYSTVSHRACVRLAVSAFVASRVTKRAFATYNLEYPESLLSDRKFANGGALITSPALLKRIGHLDEADAGDLENRLFIWRSACQTMLRRTRHASWATVLWRFLGSTETSGVAWRKQEEHGAS